MLRAIPCPRRSHIFVKCLEHDIVARHISRVGSSSFKTRLPNFVEKLYRIMIDKLPKGWIDIREKALGFRMPTPPQVIRQIGQPSYTLRNRANRYILYDIQSDCPSVTKMKERAVYLCTPLYMTIYIVANKPIACHLPGCGVRSAEWRIRNAE